METTTKFTKRHQKAKEPDGWEPSPSNADDLRGAVDSGAHRRAHHHARHAAERPRRHGAHDGRGGHRGLVGAASHPEKGGRRCPVGNIDGFPW